MLKNPTTVHITIFATIGAFSVSALSIFLGYKLFVAGATGKFMFSVVKKVKLP